MPERKPWNKDLQFNWDTINKLKSLLFLNAKSAIPGPELFFRGSNNGSFYEQDSGSAASDLISRALQAVGATSQRPGRAKIQNRGWTVFSFRHYFHFLPQGNYIYVIRIPITSYNLEIFELCGYVWPCSFSFFIARLSRFPGASLETQRTRRKSLFLFCWAPSGIPG